MEETNNNSKINGADGAAICFGIINLVLVLLFFLIKRVIFGAPVLLFFLLGFYAVCMAIKNGIKEKDFKCLGMGILGFILNIAAVGLLILAIIRIFTV